MKKKKNLKIKPTDQNTINPKSHLWDCGDQRGGGCGFVVIGVVEV